SMTVLEALSVGTPVIVPNHGSFAAIVSDRREAMLFSPGDVLSLASTMQAAVSASEPGWMASSGYARNKFLHELTAETNYEQLMRIYQKAREQFAAMSSPGLAKEKRKRRYEPAN
ncbi:MAG TPA: glycosyltransferase, partial [Candidatus Acidoferrum sp.]|nr:glycosyltransferase [Candidatus Acidoferrum sp.]